MAFLGPASVGMPAADRSSVGTSSRLCRRADDTVPSSGNSPPSTREPGAAQVISLGPLSSSSRVTFCIPVVAPSWRGLTAGLRDRHPALIPWGPGTRIPYTWAAPEAASISSYGRRRGSVQPTPSGGARGGMLWARHGCGMRDAGLGIRIVRHAYGPAEIFKRGGAGSAPSEPPARRRARASRSAEPTCLAVVHQLTRVGWGVEGLAKALRTRPRPVIDARLRGMRRSVTRGADAAWPDGAKANPAPWRKLKGRSGRSSRADVIVHQER